MTYFERDGVVIYLGDALEIVPTLEKDVADLLVTDPPYGIDFNSGRSDNFAEMHGDDDNQFVTNVLELSRKPLKRSRHAYLFGPSEVLPEHYAARTELVWDKQIQGMGNLKSPWGTQHEMITFSVAQDSKANIAKGSGKGAARLRQGSILSYQRKNSLQNNRHPTEKPVPLLRRLIESSTLLGETVLDPFLGSGSTLVAAIAEGRKGIGIEISPRYFAEAVTRCNQALDAKELFDQAIT